MKKENDELKHENLKLRNSIALFNSSLTDLVKAEVKGALQQASKSNEIMEMLTLKNTTQSKKQLPIWKMTRMLLITK
ncbi:MAG: hypothetical protein Q8N03_16095 [Ignavibacteria bacterium]|nr:hypothetical protein [Ignavibacteria bacterium]